jgi:hypothetical protein
MEAMLMTLPRVGWSSSGWLSICVIAALQPRKTPLALTAMVKSHCSSVSSTIVCRPVNTPALLTKTSRRPNADTAVSTSAWT